MNLVSLMDSKYENGKIIHSILSKDSKEKKVLTHVELCCQLIIKFLELIKNDNQTESNVLQNVVLRGYESLESAILLSLSGFEMQASSLLRDVIEVEMLLRYFIKNPEEIEIWWKSNTALRSKKYTPVKLRKAIAKNPKELDQLTIDYKGHCEIGTHVTPLSVLLGKSRGIDHEMMKQIYISFHMKEISIHAERLAKPVGILGYALTKKSTFFRSKIKEINESRIVSNKDLRHNLLLTKYRIALALPKATRHSKKVN